MARSYRLLHLSDLHITSASLHGGSRPQRFRAWKERSTNPADLLSRPADRSLLKALARTAYEISSVDAVLITGDLANRGDRQSLEAALQLVNAPAGSGWKTGDDQPTLQGAGAQIWLLPGNHDRYDQLAGAGGRTFDQVFQRDWKVGQGAASVTVGEVLGIVLGDLTLARSSDAEGLLSAWGQGRAYPERVAFMELETQLLRAVHPQITVLWAVHFAPRFQGLSGSLRLLEEDRLLAAAQAQGISHILCGHTHEPRHYCPLGWQVEVLCTGSAAQRGPHINTIHLIEVEVAAGAVVRFEPTALRFEPKEGTFVPLD